MDLQQFPARTSWLGPSRILLEHPYLEEKAVICLYYTHLLLQHLETKTLIKTRCFTPCIGFGRNYGLLISPKKWSCFSGYFAIMPFQPGDGATLWIGPNLPLLGWSDQIISILHVVLRTHTKGMEAKFTDGSSHWSLWRGLVGNDPMANEGPRILVSLDCRRPLIVFSEKNYFRLHGFQIIWTHIALYEAWFLYIWHLCISS